MRVLWVAVSFAMVLAFQNCAKSDFKPAEEAAVLGEKTTGEQGSGLAVEKLSQFHFPNATAVGSDAITRITMVMKSGQLVIERHADERTCLMSEEKLGEFQDLFKEAELCAPKVAEGDMGCMAFGIPDIELGMQNGDSMNLQPIVCGSGFDLCGEKSRALRAKLKELARNLPEGC